MRAGTGNMEEERASKKSIPETVHEVYHKMFPGAGCPVTGASREHLIAAALRSPPQPDNAAAAAAASCSTTTPKYKHPHVYDAYGRRVPDENRASWPLPDFLYSASLSQASLPDEISPANRMPLHANQTPAPGQKEPLSTHRQRSSIPKAGTDGAWLYPSPQMFYNSLVRKKIADDVTERDMADVVASHNAMNEATWARLLQWEHLYSQMYPESSEEGPRLLHLRARPQELTPKAYVKKMLGYGVPFDRHDWTVDRGGREMRYVIDYYDHGRVVWDVRPALDSPSALLLRARMMLQELVAWGVASHP